MPVPADPAGHPRPACSLPRKEHSTAHPTAAESLAGIYLKITRAEEHIRHLSSELGSVLDPQQDDLVDYDAAAEEAFRKAHDGAPVPLKLSVVSGEAIYQLRSSLDHLICALIVRDGGEPGNQSQFPVFVCPPTTRKMQQRYEQQVAGIRRDEVLAIIEDEQPYRWDPPPQRQWLAILRALCNADKHRQLIIHRTTIYPRINIKLRSPQGFEICHSRPDDGREDDDDAWGTERIKTRHLLARPSFDGIGNPPFSFPVVEGLNQMLLGLTRVVRRLEPHLQ